MKFIEQSRKVVVGGMGWELVHNGYTVLLLQDEKILESCTKCEYI